MRRWVAILLLVCSFSGSAQTVANPYEVLHPIMKDPNKRNAPTSLNQSPGELSAPAPAAARPVAVVSRIEVGLAASAIRLLGTIDGLKGRMYVTNIGTLAVTPLAQFAVCDPRGLKVGLASKTGSLLAPNASEQIEVLATNLNAADLKLMNLSAKK